MKKTVCLFLILIILGGMLMIGCENVATEPQMLENIRIWAETGTVLTETDGTRVLQKDKNAPAELTFTDWYNNTHTEKFNFKGVSLFIDIGFPAEGGKITLGGAEKVTYRVFASDDGYNFTRFLGTFTGSEFEFTGKYKAFNIIFQTETVSLSEITVKALPAAEKTLLSLGASYIWEGTGMKDYSDKENTKLTDGIYFKDGGESAVAAKNSHEIDGRTGKKGNIITLDLGEVKNVSEVSLGGYLTGNIKAVISDRIAVRYSTDGETWQDFGQSFLVEKAGNINRFTVTRPFTAEARFIKVFTYADGIFATDEIEVWGADTPVAEPAYTSLSLPKGDTNTIKSAGENALTDGVFNKGIKTEKINIKASGVTKAINIVSTAKVTDISVAGKIFAAETAGIHTCLITLDTPIEETEFTLTFKCAGEITEIQTFGEDIQKPLVDGGFYQLPTNGGNDVSTQNDAYSWFLSLKGMRDLGMSTVIIQYSTHFNAKTTLINGKNILSAGYTYTPTYGAEDLCKAVLDGAEKLGMKVFIGTIHDADFTNPAQNQAQYDAIVADGEKVIKDIHEMYSSHPAFGGYYLSDETCDYWLNIKGGVEAARKVYEGQSEVIRVLDKDALIMIAPAIWRSGSIQKAEENIYNLIKPAKEGEKPVVDIVAVQDCLGREQTLTVSDKVYTDWLAHAQSWAKGIRKAGADFWHDAEVFEIIYTSKRAQETEKSLALQYSLSGGIIVFDIPHYMTPMALWGTGDCKGMYKSNIMKDYIQYYEEAK